jgi:glycosyltransferase involved in cell wall biosynthesis
MLIGIDALGIEKASGGRTATLNLLRPLFQIDRSNKFIVMVSSYEPLFEAPEKNVQQRIVPFRNRFLRRIYAQLTFPYFVRDCDVVHFTKNLSLWGPLPPRIVTIYDLTTLKLPHLIPKSDYWYWRTLQKWSLQSAQCIITISHSAAEDIQRYYKIPNEKIRVIYPAIDPRFYKRSIEEITFVQKKYNLPDDYLIHVGRIDPIKNLTTLIKAFARLKQNKLYAGKLVLVGEPYKKSPDLSVIPLIQELNLKNDVILTGYISDDDLPAVFSGACLKVFPSHNEGFGLVALEAMACGVPIIAHRAGGALVEVIGDAGIITDSNDLETIYAAIVRVITDPALQDEMRIKGFEQVHHFNWEETARQTLALYSEIAQNRKR